MLLALALALGLGGCAGRVPPKVGPWAYEFQLGEFKDLRKQDDAMMMASEPFTVHSFMTGWRNSVGRSVFASTPAKLDVTLNSYEMSSSGNSYALSMDVSLRARSIENAVLGKMNAKCDAIERITPMSWWDFWQQARAQGTTTPLTAAPRNATMWQKVMDSCVAELAKQFDTTLAEGVR